MSMFYTQRSGRYMFPPLCKSALKTVQSKITISCSDLSVLSLRGRRPAAINVYLLPKYNFCLGKVYQKSNITQPRLGPVFPESLSYSVVSPASWLLFLAPEQPLLSANRPFRLVPAARISGSCLSSDKIPRSQSSEVSPAREPGGGQQRGGRHGLKGSNSRLRRHLLW